MEDIAAALEEVEAQGGEKHIGPIPLPNGQFFAWFRDPDGNIAGLVTPGQ